VYNNLKKERNTTKINYKREGASTITHDCLIRRLDDGEECRPSSKIGEVERDVIIFCEDVKIGGVEVEEVKG